ERTFLQQAVVELKRRGNDRDARYLEAACAEYVGGELTGRAVERRNNPRLVHQLGQLHAAFARPRVVRAGDDAELLLEENLRLEFAIRKRRKDMADREFATAPAQRLAFF